MVAGAESPVRCRGFRTRRRAATNNCSPRHLLSDRGHSPNSGVAGHNCWPPLTCKSPSAFFPVASTPLQDKVLVGSFHQPQLQRIFQQHFLGLQPHLEELCAASGAATYLSSLPLPSQPVFTPLLLLPPNLPSAAGGGGTSGGLPHFPQPCLLSHVGRESANSLPPSYRQTGK